MGDKTKVIDIWHDEEKVYYFFLLAIVNSHRVYLDNRGAGCLAVLARRHE